MPDWLINAAIFLGVFFAMEGIAFATHKYIMHGALWVLHASHHRERESWFEEPGFRGSFVGNAATELRSELDHPAQAKIVQHRLALRQLLEDLAKASGAYDPAVLAAQLQILIDGAISAAAVDRDPTAAAGARALAKAAIAASSTS